MRGLIEILVMANLRKEKGKIYSMGISLCYAMLCYTLLLVGLSLKNRVISTSSAVLDDASG